MYLLGDVQTCIVECPTVFIAHLFVKNRSVLLVWIDACMQDLHAARSNVLKRKAALKVIWFQACTA